VFFLSILLPTYWYLDRGRWSHSRKSLLNEAAVVLKCENNPVRAPFIRRFMKLLVSLLATALLTSCISETEIEESTKFKYKFNDRVEVNSGFYQNSVGQIQSYFRCRDPETRTNTFCYRLLIGDHTPRDNFRENHLQPSR
jgi:hypothetical protein